MFDEVNTLVFAMAGSVVISVLLTSVYFIFLLSALKKKMLRNIKTLETQSNVLNSTALGMGQKILLLEKNLTALRKTQNEMKSSGLDISYNTAEKLISQGIDDRAIAANSGLSSSEINLMRLLHRSDSQEFKNNTKDDVNFNLEQQRSAEDILEKKIREYQSIQEPLV